MLVRRSIGRIKKMRTYIFVSLVYFKLWRVDKVLLHVFSETVDKIVFFFLSGFYAALMLFISHWCFFFLVIQSQATTRLCYAAQH